MRNNTKSTENKNRQKQGDDKETQCEKKTFDKKKYRLQKYSNKYKINQWEEKRKKAVLREFHKELKRSQDSTQASGNLSNTSKDAEETSNKMKSYAFYKAKQEYHHKQEEMKRKKEEAIRIKAEREEALRKYKEKKIRAFRALSKKTKKGQPVMKGRMELLLEKIQQNLT